MPGLEMTEKHHLHPLALLLLVSALAYVSHTEYIKIATPVFSTWANWHDVHMNGLAPNPLQFRVLSFLLPEAAMRVFDAKAETTYLTMRFVFLVLAGLLMVRLLRAYVPTGQALTITILFFLLYNLSALPHIQPAEEINIAIFAAAFEGELILVEN